MPSLAPQPQGDLDLKYGQNGYMNSTSNIDREPQYIRGPANQTFKRKSGLVSYGPGLTAVQSYQFPIVLACVNRYCLFELVPIAQNEACEKQTRIGSPTTKQCRMLIRKQRLVCGTFKSIHVVKHGPQIEMHAKASAKCT